MKPSQNLKPLTAGAAFAFLIGDDRYAVCRVLLDAQSEPAKRLRTHPVLVACSKWIGNQVPHVDEADLRPILHLSHHTWNQRHVLWISEPLPSEFIPIGVIAPTPEEQAIECLSFGNWSTLAIQPLLQWRWEHDQLSVLVEDRQDAAKAIESRQSAAETRQKYLESVTLEQLCEVQFFKNWEEFPPPRATQAARQIMRRTVEELLELGRHASKKARLKVLQRCIESFNDLDQEFHCIETSERDDICEEFAAIVYACGLRNHVDLADRWRQW